MKLIIQHNEKKENQKLSVQHFVFTVQSQDDKCKKKKKRYVKILNT